jgi:hypothetical protein
VRRWCTIEHASNQSCALPVSTRDPLPRHITLPRARSTSQAADNVTVTWRICTTESKVRARRESQGDGAIFEAAWVTARNAEECLYHGGVWRREKLGGREGGCQEIQDSAGWAPMAPAPKWKEKSGYLPSIFEMKGSESNRTLCQGVYDRGASSSLGQSRYL